MTRLFDEHYIRRVQSLDGAWRFETDPDDCGKINRWELALPHAHTVTVPSVWNTEQGLLTYEGVGWYEKNFYTDGGRLRICFDAVMTEAQVYFDGKPIAQHYGGFTQFCVIVSDVPQGVHRLTVRVDNRFDAQSIPQEHVDWYHYGGIPRSVSVEQLQGICVLSNRLEYTLNDERTIAHCTPVVQLFNATSVDTTTTLSLTLQASVVCSLSVTLAAGEMREMALPCFTVNDVQLWDIGKPSLYTLHYTTDTDDLFDRVGFRHIAVTDGRVCLNGRPIEIRGVNRHEEAPEWGFALPVGLMLRDLDHILAMGCNAIRGAHYPNAKTFLDLVDEAGLLFWSEIPIWGGGFSEEALADAVVVERGLTMHREMAEQYYNHPCIVLWGMHNEIKTETQAALAMTKAYYGFLRAHGGNRLVVYASDHPMVDICFAYSDILCLNQYHGWYYGYEPDAWERFLAAFSERKAALGMADKPVIMSEFGAAALYGCHDDEGILWSEENQAMQLRRALTAFHRDPQMAGCFIWQFCDIRTCLQAGINRARGFNNKGIMNEYRKPKLSYYVTKDCFCVFAKDDLPR